MERPFPHTRLVYVLTIRNSGEEDDVYLFYQYSYACEQAFEYFDMLEKDTDPIEEINDLEAWLFEHDKGYFTIFSTNVH